MAIPPPPPGFTLDQPDAGAVPPPPPGFTLDAPVTQEPVRMDRKAFNAELLRRVRETDETPEQIREWARSVRQPARENATDLTYDLTDRAAEEIAAIRGRANVPAQVIDISKRNTGLGPILRGGTDFLLFNRGDELAAGLETGFGLAGNYDEALQELRVIRAQDDPTDRFFGQLGGAALTMGAGALPGAAGRAAMAVPAWVAAPTSIVGRAGRAAVAGAGSGALYSSGALTGDETLGEAATETAIGAGQGLMTAGILSPAIDLTAAGGRKVIDLFSGRSGATSALETVAKDVAQAYPTEFAALRQQNGRDPTFADVLRFRFTQLQQQLGHQPNMGEILGPQGARLTETLAAAPENAARFGEAVQGAVARTGREVTAKMAPGARDSQAIIDNANRRADIEFAPYKDQKVQLSPTEQLYIRSGIEELPNALGALKGADKERITNALMMGEITGGDLDLLRRALRKQSRSDMGASFSTMAEQVEDVITTYIPGSARAVKNYARRMSRAEGSDVGRKGVTQGSTAFEQNLRRPELSQPTGITPAEQAILDTLPAKDRGRVARLGGARLGIRAEVADAVNNNSGAAYTMAARVGDGTTNFAQNLRSTLGEREAGPFISYLQGQKQAIDSLAALSGMRPEQVATNLDTLEEITKAGFFQTTGGAGKAGFLARMSRETFGIGKDAARKLADDLLDPAKFEPAMRLLEKRGVTRDRINRIARDSILAAMSGNTETPEGAISTRAAQE